MKALNLASVLLQKNHINTLTVYWIKQQKNYAYRKLYTNVSEFSIIQQYFQQPPRSDNVLLGSGDDCALLHIPQHQQLAVSMDTLVSGVHFPTTTSPADIAYKAVAINVSDLAAMGAKPAWLTMSLTLPLIDHSWLQAFSTSLMAALEQFNLQLIGGDLSQGPLSITAQAHGLLANNTSLLRSAAQVDDRIYVTGTLGDAGLGLACSEKKISLTVDDEQFVLQRLHRPTPRVETGLAIVNFAHAAIDISDGFIQDLQHILTASQIGATIFIEDIPLSAPLIRHTNQQQAWQYALTAGDDYELCFTVPPTKQSTLENILSQLNCPYTCIGHITQQQRLQILHKDGSPYKNNLKGFEHFREN
ncbi:MAG: thiamine-phosphate kinase [Gammaproteobacteria bacterium]|nr:thiamine-phosphate kinase [Gammaproteobacteria bacterium]